jgi:hypothetical protein
MIGQQFADLLQEAGELDFGHLTACHGEFAVRDGAFA